jgi:hypothetical protein
MGNTIDLHARFSRNHQFYEQFLSAFKSRRGRFDPVG